MSKQTEALKLALEALEDTLSGDLTPYQAAKTITVIREALAEQPAQQWNAGVPSLYPEPEPGVSIKATYEQPAQSLPWHHPDCEGECIACLIEREVEAAYGTQGLAYLRRHVSGGGIKGDA